MKGDGEPAGIRTQDTRIKSPVLWPTELPAHAITDPRAAGGRFGLKRVIHHSDILGALATAKLGEKREE